MWLDLVRNSFLVRDSNIFWISADCKAILRYKINQNEIENYVWVRYKSIYILNYLSSFFEVFVFVFKLSEMKSICICN